MKKVDHLQHLRDLFTQHEAGLEKARREFFKSVSDVAAHLSQTEKRAFLQEQIVRGAALFEGLARQLRGSQKPAPPTRSRKRGRSMRP